MKISNLLPLLGASLQLAQNSCHSVCTTVAPVKLTVDEQVIVLHQVAHSITILLEEATKTYVFTPDNPQKAVEAINKQIP